VVQERGAVGGQPHRPRRALDQPLAEHGLKPLQLHADRGLRGAERLGGAGKTCSSATRRKACTVSMSSVVIDDQQLLSLL